MTIKFINYFKPGTMKVRSLLFLTLLFCVVLSTNAQTNPAQPMKFSLSEAKNYALNNSPVLLNSARDVEIAKKMIWENTATGLPQVDANSAYSYSPTVFRFNRCNCFVSGRMFKPNDLKTSFFQRSG